jgi:hypothetical protein
MYDIITWVKSRNWKIWSTVIFAAIGYGCLIFNAIKIGSSEHIPITYMTCISAWILGWIVAIITTPYDKSDEDKIGKFTKMVGSFLSGYLLSKFDKVIEKAITPAIVLSDIYGIRILLFACFFGLTWIFVFVFRQYTRLG